MTINTVAQGNISLTAIDLEINGTNGTNKSLRALSAAAGKSSPDGLSEFSGYSHIINHSTTILPDFWATGGGAYSPTFYYSGYATGSSTAFGVGDALGNASFPDSGTINFGGLTRNANDIEITYAYFWSTNNNTNSANFQMTLRDNSSDHGTSWSNAGFTNIEFYLGQTNTSGSPDLTLARTAATTYFSDGGSYTQMTYIWSTAKPFSSYFGNSSNPSTNGYSTMNITGLGS